MTARSEQLFENSDLWQFVTLGIVLPARKGTKDDAERAAGWLDPQNLDLYFWSWTSKKYSNMG
jgi:hypothetical protein